VPRRDCLAWLRAARELLAETCGAPSGPITVIIANEHGQGIEFTLPPDDCGRQATRYVPTQTLRALAEPRLRRVEQAALNAATTSPIPVKALARQAGYKQGSYFSEAVTHLCRLGRLARHPDGVCLPALAASEPGA
jgi:hypothetical protein